jgi:anti-sigma factor RsiW
MYTRFTEEHLVQYLYGEMPTTDRLALEHALETDTTLQKALKNLSDVKDILDYGLMEPDPTTIEMIMEHGHYEELPH